METINFNGKDYPALQAHGFASQYSFPFATLLCKGEGVDVGYSKPEWKLPGAIGVDLDKVSFASSTGESDMNGYSATNFIGQELDYIFSSHCLEHLNDWVGVLDYWSSKLKSGGVLFLYLPNTDYQEYWRPMHNRKHCNWLTPAMLKSYYESRSFKNVFVTEGYDLNGSFYAVGECI
jgi:predicted SAM-dependent methyltransferase